MILRTIAFMLAVTSVVQAAFVMPVGRPDFSDWKGVATVADNTATLSAGKTASYTYSNQNRIYFPGIKRDYYGDSADWTDYTGLSFEVYLENESVAEIAAVLKVDPKDANECNPVSTANIRLTGLGWLDVYIPWEMFDIDAGQKWGTLLAIKQVELSAGSTLQIRNVQVKRGRTIGLRAPVQGKAADAGSTVSYEFEVGNSADKPKAVSLRVETIGWESMNAVIEPAVLDMAPGEVKTAVLKVDVPSKLPTGIREQQIVKAISNGDGASVGSLEFTTAVRVPTPNITFTSDGWNNVRAKVDQYDWAKDGLADYEKKARGYKPPKANKINPADGAENLGKSIFTTDGRKMLDVAIAYQLTGKNEYAEKVLKVIRPLVDPETGFPATLVGGGNSFVGEGKFWQSAARAWDLVRDSELVTNEDRKRVDATFRLFAERTIKGNTRGAISNWNVAEITAALYCALNLQDWHLINQLLESPTGIYAHLEHGIMSDGWWYECAVGYNTWVASEFSETAIALEPWGINFKDRRFPIGTTKHFSLLASRRVGGQYGMEFEKWGSIEKNNVGIKDMWDAAVPFLDYRSVLPAINDAIHEKVSGKPYELAYYLYRDPEYAAIIQRGEGRDLLYGVPDLPDVTSEKMKRSAYADNMGIVQLRSQTQGREQREQIQAALHYGSHGGYHGHFDRTGMISMMRYGKSPYGPLMYWYGYGSYLYKFLKQTSTTKNMVVVDEKQQEPKENWRTLFHSGEMMQAAVVETVSRWSYPPYGGIVYNPEGTFADQMWEEGRSIPIPENAPEYGTCTEYTEPVTQRRLMLVLDDYIVHADYLKGEKEHQFDWMFQSKGFLGLEADKKELVRRSAQMNRDPLGSAQFVTDCYWYAVEGTSRASFQTRWGEGADNSGVRLRHSTDGVLKIDIFNAWPKQAEIMIGTAPECHKVNKQLKYAVKADGETLFDGRTGAWILGTRELELNISGRKQLVLTTKVDNDRNDTIFWGNARLVLNDGSEVFLSTLPVEYNNIVMPGTQGLDYYGGPVKIAGELQSDSTPGMPDNTKEYGTITVDLSGLNAVAFKARLGGDFPLGDETQRLKTMAVRTNGTGARFLSVIEPHEAESMIKSVTAKSADELTVELIDGRVQEITISGLDHEENDQTIATVKEFKDGQLVREETSAK
ncbi:alginate lyase family protein [Pontiellaceae bacterium B12227]|nr:alginate lyase family protein [Pontiellaceae bacterium B12227]